MYMYMRNGDKRRWHTFEARLDIAGIGAFSVP